MCMTCKRGIALKPGDLVIRMFRASEWDSEKEMTAWYCGGPTRMRKSLANGAGHPIS